MYTLILQKMIITKTPNKTKLQKTKQDRKKINNQTNKTQHILNSDLSFYPTEQKNDVSRC